MDNNRRNEILRNIDISIRYDDVDYLITACNEYKIFNIIKHFHMMLLYLIYLEYH